VCRRSGSGGRLGVLRTGHNCRTVYFRRFGRSYPRTGGQGKHPAIDYGRLTTSAGRRRVRPFLVQKVYEGAHLRQKQAVARDQDAQWRGRPLIGLEHNPEPSVCETMRNPPGRHRRRPGSPAPAGHPEPLIRRAGSDSQARRRRRA
jgi:hypothetical protein